MQARPSGQRRPAGADEDADEAQQRESKEPLGGPSQHQRRQLEAALADRPGAGLHLEQLDPVAGQQQLQCVADCGTHGPHGCDAGQGPQRGNLGIELLARIADSMTAAKGSVANSADTTEYVLAASWRLNRSPEMICLASSILLASSFASGGCAAF
jgi:hypothetical protein